jgi:hypothetical protein
MQSNLSDKNSPLVLCFIYFTLVSYCYSFCKIYPVIVHYVVCSRLKTGKAEEGMKVVPLKNSTSAHRQMIQLQPILSA